MTGSILDYMNVDSTTFDAVKRTAGVAVNALAFPALDTSCDAGRQWVSDWAVSAAQWVQALSAKALSTTSGACNEIGQIESTLGICDTNLGASVPAQPVMTAG